MAKKKDPETTTMTTTGPTDLAEYDYGEDQGEALGSEHQLIPFLKILQGLSPECQGEEAKGRPGMIANSATGEIYSGKDGIVLTLAEIGHAFLAWKPDRGGFAGRHDPRSAVVQHAQKTQEFGEWTDDKGNTLDDTFEMYVIVENDGQPDDWAILSFSRTKIKAYKAYMSRVGKIRVGPGRQQVPPLFAHRFRLTTQLVTNDQGSYYVPVLTPAVDNDVSKSLLRPDDPRFQAGKMFAQIIREGTFRVDYDAGKEESEGTSGGKADPEAAPF